MKQTTIRFFIDELHVEPGCNRDCYCHQVEGGIWLDDLITALIKADVSVEEITEVAKKAKIELDSIFARPLGG